MNDEISDEEDIRSGIPQGSVMGLLLFLIYIGDISNDSGCLVYFDDVKSMIINNEDYVLKHQEQLQRIYNWGRDHNSIFNE